MAWLTAQRAEVVIVEHEAVGMTEQEPDVFGVARPSSWPPLGVP